MADNKEDELASNASSDATDNGTTPRDLLTSIAAIVKRSDPWSHIAIFSDMHDVTTRATAQDGGQESVQLYSALCGITEEFEDKLMTELEDERPAERTRLAEAGNRLLTWMTKRGRARLAELTAPEPEPTDNRPAASRPAADIPKAEDNLSERLVSALERIERPSPHRGHFAKLEFRCKPWSGDAAALPEFVLRLEKSARHLKLTRDEMEFYIRNSIPSAIEEAMPQHMDYGQIKERLWGQYYRSGSYKLAVMRKLRELQPPRGLARMAVVNLFDYIITSYNAAHHLGMVHPLDECGGVPAVLRILSNHPREQERITESLRETPDDRQATQLVAHLEGRAADLRFLAAFDDTAADKPTTATYRKIPQKPPGSRPTSSYPVYHADILERADPADYDAPTTRDSPQQNSRGTHFKCNAVGCKQADVFHTLDNCSVFLEKSPMLRAAFLVDRRRCQVCAKRTHAGGEASCWKVGEKDTNYFCKSCGGFHHPKTCPSTFPKGENVPGFKVFVGRVKAQNADTPPPIFQQEIIPLHGRAGAGVVFYDSGSGVTFVRQRLADELGLERAYTTSFAVTSVQGFQSEVEERPIYKLPLGEDKVVEAVGIGHITTLAGTPRAEEFVERHELPSTALTTGEREVDVLLGADNADLMPRFVQQVEDGLTLSRSVLTGQLLLQGGTNRFSIASTLGATRVPVHRVATVKTEAENLFFRAEAMGTEAARACRNCERCAECSFTSRHLAKKEHDELQLIKENLSFNPSNLRWVAKYPKNELYSLLPDNRGRAYRRLIQLEKKLASNKDLKEEFMKTFGGAVERGLFVKLDPKEAAAYPGKVHYTPLVLVKKESESTPLRLCADSADKKPGGISLNDTLVKGPPSLNSMLGVLLNFRVGPAAAVGDAAKFYNSVASVEEDCHLRRVMWRDMDQTREPDEYKTTSVNFGEVGGGVTSMTAASEGCEPHKEEYPKAVDVITKKSYVDDFPSSHGSRVTMLRVLDEVDLILNQNGFHIKKWLRSGDPEKVKVLGVWWDAETDSLILRPGDPAKDVIKDEIKPLPYPCSKRELYSEAMQVFDPMGLLAPLVIKLKLIMRAASNGETSWDDAVDDELREQAVMVFDEIQTLSGYKIPRAIFPEEYGEHEKPRAMLVVFVDASSCALCGLVYLVAELDEVRLPTLILAKTKIAPRPTPTVPKLELMAAQMGARMAERVEDALTDVSITSRRYLTDSTVVLHQLNRTTSHKDVYTTAKTYEILTRTKAEEWLHVGTTLNAADIGTRQDATAETVRSTVYQRGPEFLSTPPDTWPTRSFEQLKQVHLVGHVGTEAENCLDELRRRPLLQYVRVLGWVAAAAVRFKRPLSSSTSTDAPAWRRYRPDGTCRAESGSASKLGFKVAAALAQQEYGGVLDLKKCASLRPQNVTLPGLSLTLSVAMLRQGANLAAKRAEPLAILRRGTELAKKIAAYSHTRVHGGVDATTEETRRWAWILGARKAAAEQTTACLRCKLESGRPLTQLMGPAPRALTTPCPPFAAVQIDLAGPYTVSCSHHPRSRVKVWVLIAACQSSAAAVYLDLVEGYTAAAICRGLRRLTCRWGAVVAVHTDAGPNVIKAVQLYNTTANPPADHIWAPPRGQHRNGKAERAVKAFKRLLPPKWMEKNTMNQSDFQLLLEEVAYCLNDRPIGVHRGAENVWTSTLITPNSILLPGRSLDPMEAYMPDGGAAALSNHVKTCLARARKLVHDVRMPTLGRTGKWRDETAPLPPGTLVAFIDANKLADGVYHLAVVVDSVPSTTNTQTRTYVIQTRKEGQTILKTLPVNQLVLLEYPAGADTAGGGVCREGREEGNRTPFSVGSAGL